MKVIFGFNDIRQDGMASAAITLMRALKAQGIEVQPLHAWNCIKVPGYVEEFNPRFASDSEEELLVEDGIRAMVEAVNSDPEVNIFSHFGAPNWACVLPFLREDIRVVVSVHSTSPSALKIGMAYKERVSAFVPISWGVENQLLKKLSKKEQHKSHRILNAVDVLPPKSWLANKSTTPVKIGFWGRVEDVTKGCDKIPPIARMLKERGLNFQWDLYGYFHWGFEDRFYPIVEANGVGDVINYCGCLNPDQVPESIKNYDIMVMPSNHEGFGLALVEAMVVGLACVASRLPGSIEGIIDNGKNGLLCPKNDLESFADAIEELIKDPELRKEIGQNARKKVIECFSVEAQGKAYKALFDKVMSERDYKMIKAPSLDNYRKPEIVKPHILARILPLWIKKWLKKVLK